MTKPRQLSKSEFHSMYDVPKYEYVELIVINKQIPRGMRISFAI